MALGLTWLELLVVALAAYRVTRFIVLDTWAGDPPSEDEPRGTSLRRRLDEFAYDEEGRDRSFVRGKVGDLLQCPWCTGFWVSAGSLLGWVSGPEWLRWGLLAFAVAGAQGFLQSRFGA